MTDDITPQSQAALAASEQLYRDLVENVNSIILRWDGGLRINFINHFGAQFFGYTPAELQGQSILGTIVDSAESTGRSLRAMLDDILAHPESYINNENENVTRDGRKVWVCWTNQPVRGPDGALTGVLSVGNDITGLKQAQSELKRALNTNEQLLKETEDLNHRLALMARTDQLTGLLNRRSMIDKLAEEFFRAGRYEYPLGLLMLDIDHFKQVNDSYGHEMGDQILRVISRVLAETVRQDDTVARFGGEEICVIMPYASTARCWNAGERLRRAVEERTTELSGLGEIPRVVTISVGGASSEKVDGSENDLLKAADEMLYQSKAQGRNRVSVVGQ